jgi:hypothetical protein
LIYTGATAGWRRRTDAATGATWHEGRRGRLTALGLLVLVANLLLMVAPAVVGVLALAGVLS